MAREEFQTRCATQPCSVAEGPDGGSGRGQGWAGVGGERVRTLPGTSARGPFPAAVARRRTGSIIPRPSPSCSQPSARRVGTRSRCARHQRGERARGPPGAGESCLVFWIRTGAFPMRPHRADEAPRALAAECPLMNGMHKARLGRVVRKMRGPIPRAPAEDGFPQPERSARHRGQRGLARPRGSARCCGTVRNLRARAFPAAPIGARPSMISA